ncbi:MAG: UDP-2,3-diacylglucosamine diphosphatase [Calditrichaeota bacterium]|nr:UDP-2,3-diacylglucosamine diphosphatase [Calditrichota bacterium]
MKAYFISDLHLGAKEITNRKEQEETVWRLFAEIEREATHLFVVGDFFDFWFEYKSVIPKQYFPVLCLLSRFKEKGIEMRYLAGNHDFALGTFFDRYLNIKTYLNECVTDLNGKRFFLFHGDGIDSKDVGYRFLKKILRSRLNQKLFRLIHPDFGFRFAGLVSGSSRKYNNQDNKNRSEADYIAFAEQKFEQGFDYVIMGHRHNPLEHTVGSKKYVNLGDWINNYSYAVFDGSDLVLKFMEAAKDE